MGDYRCFIKIEMSTGGEVLRHESSLNWHPREIHPAVLKWLEEAWSELAGRITDDIIEAEERAQAIEIERRERLLLAKLKNKYEGAPMPPIAQGSGLPF